MPLPGVCRPPKLTCRWVNEMARTMGMLCPAAPSPPQCFSTSNTEVLWRIYLSRLQETQCTKLPLVQQVLAFELDYHTILDE